MIHMLALRLRTLARWRSRRELGRFARFAIVGASGFLVDFAVLNLLLFWAHLPPWLANTGAFTLAVMHTFTWNRIWTFPESRCRPVATQLAQFFLVSLVGYAINQGVFLGSHALIWRHLAVMAAGWNLAKMTASGVVMFWNFGANRLWTWRGL